jgi:hypothetical protein
MGTTVARVPNSVNDLPDFIRQDHLAISEIRVCGLGRIFDLECKGERNIHLYRGSSHQSTAEHCDETHCRAYRNSGLHFNPFESTHANDISS